MIFKIEILKNKIIFNHHDIHHIVKVLRKKQNDIIDCTDFVSNLYKTKIVSISPFIVEVIEINPITNHPYEINFYLGVIKKPNFELAIKMLNELNIKEITPVYFDYSQKNIILDYDRLYRIIEESSKQCKRMIPIKINKSINFDELLNQIKNGNNFYANEKEESKSLKDFSFLEPFQKLNLIVGPEGGFSEKENNLLKSNSHSIKLTNSILRAETAAIYMGSLFIEELKKYEN